MGMKLEEWIGYGVIFGFIGLGWLGFAQFGFSPSKALGMALTGIPLGALAPVFCASRQPHA